LKGMVTRSSSSDIFAVFLGGLDWEVWVNWLVWLSCAVLWYAIGTIEGRRGGSRKWLVREPSFNWQLRLATTGARVVYTTD
jgi:hypothetical protein